MHLIDPPAPLDFYNADRTKVLRRASAAGVKTILAIGIGEGPDSMHHALSFASGTSAPDLPRIYASAGIHPEQAHNATEEALAKVARLAEDPNCIAIGEI